MGLVLSHRDIARFRAASEALLCPVAYEHLDDWALAALRRIRELHRCDHAQLLVPLHGRFTMWAVGLRPELLRAIRDLFVGMEPGLNRVTDPAIDHRFRRRHSAGIRVFSHVTMEQIAGDTPAWCAHHAKRIMPLGTAYGFGLRVPLPLGEANVTVGFLRPSDDPFGVEYGTALLGMLLPAFDAAVGRLAHLPRARGTPTALYDATGTARDGTPLPTSDELVARCHLTVREADVALLLAVGASDREIGWRLEISPHTARKHVEHIFDKLHLHSRKAFALRLSATAEAKDASTMDARTRHTTFL
jgi:DNA-binding CsgD family transcriptional regulator